VSDAPAILLDQAGIRRALSRIAHEIIEHNPDLDAFVLVGIRSRGIQLATRIADRLRELTGKDVPVGSIDISPYRDDLDRPVERIEETSADVPMPIDHRVVGLVDDVLATGRTVRVALDVLSGLGRPRAIQVAVLIDRGEREVPIRADYVGHNVPRGEPRRVHVRVRELDGADEVALQ
jgi:pyrimidine operon attenuation protein/uracil phosphoribosyltransferase